MNFVAEEALIDRVLRITKPAGIGVIGEAAIGIVIAVAFANRLILGLALLDLPALTLFLSELGMTIAFYPLVVAIAHYIMGIRKAAPGDLDALGQRV